MNLDRYWRDFQRKTGELETFLLVICFMQRSLISTIQVFDYRLHTHPFVILQPLEKTMLATGMAGNASDLFNLH